MIENCVDSWSEFQCVQRLLTFVAYWPFCEALALNKTIADFLGM